jgi:hypothetical protein
MALGLLGLAAGYAVVRLREGLTVIDESAGLLVLLLVLATVAVASVSRAIAPDWREPAAQRATTLLADAGLAGIAVGAMAAAAAPEKYTRFAVVVTVIIPAAASVALATVLRSSSGVAGWGVMSVVARALRPFLDNARRARLMAVVATVLLVGLALPAAVSSSTAWRLVALTAVLVQAILLLAVWRRWWAVAVIVNGVVVVVLGVVGTLAALVLIPNVPWLLAPVWIAGAAAAEQAREHARRQHVLARPAWFRDPWGEADLRWWDGQAWTGHTVAVTALPR